MEQLPGFAGLAPILRVLLVTDGTVTQTLEAYFECHGNLSQTAQKLHHHRNSLLYRIGRIQEIIEKWRGNFSGNQRVNTIWKIIPGFITWTLWKERNRNIISYVN